MLKKLVAIIFYGNFFYGLCTVALCAEANMQQQISLNNPVFYIFFYAATIVYYTKAYQGEIIAGSTTNKRSIWYIHHAIFVKYSQVFFTALSAICLLWIILHYAKGIEELSLFQWLEIIIFPVIALLYNGISPNKDIHLNLRQTGWLKPFFIGFVWAGAVTIYPFIFHQIETGQVQKISVFGGFLFIKNWMFITVLCIMFDIKDYAADHNRMLKTFVVRVGLRTTIYRIIIPLSVLGFISYIVFVALFDFSFIRILINSIPFILLITVAWSLHQRKSILYYLAVIDGLMLVKAACGILGVLISK